MFHLTSTTRKNEILRKSKAQIINFYGKSNQNTTQPGKNMNILDFYKIIFLFKVEKRSLLLFVNVTVFDWIMLLHSFFVVTGIHVTAIVLCDFKGAFVGERRLITNSHFYGAFIR